MPMPLPPILFEDDAIVAFAKPCGMLVSPDRWDKERPYLMRAVHEHPDYGESVANVHRLDADTSGIILCAKGREALHVLASQFEQNKVTKTYHALVRLNTPEHRAPQRSDVEPTENTPPIITQIVSFPPHGQTQDEDGFYLINIPLGQDHARAGKMRPDRRFGKPAQTHVAIRERYRGNVALVECRPLTGRTHQIRVHLAAAGMPIVADPFYSANEPLFLSAIKPRYKQDADRRERPILDRLALHASALTFTHPLSQQPITLTCDFPEDIALSLKMLRKFGA